MHYSKCSKSKLSNQTESSFPASISNFNSVSLHSLAELQFLYWCRLSVISSAFPILRCPSIVWEICLEPYHGHFSESLNPSISSINYESFQVLPGGAEQTAPGPFPSGSTTETSFGSWCGGSQASATRQRGGSTPWKPKHFPVWKQMGNRKHVSLEHFIDYIYI
jgi:hypothetical protein